jgi:hypothetical protein
MKTPLVIKYLIKIKLKLNNRDFVRTVRSLESSNKKVWGMFEPFLVEPQFVRIILSYKSNAIGNGTVMLKKVQVIG